MAVGVVPAFRSPLIQDLFAQNFAGGILPNLALVANPRDGFSPTRLSNGTEVLFFPRADLLPSVFHDRLAPIWENGIGLVLYRNEAVQVLGAIFLHGAIKNPWNAIQSGAFQCLGGIMLFSDHARENKPVEILLADVVRKATAMTDKWQFIDGNLEAIGHTTLTNLGGGKATASHPAGEKGRRDAVSVTASVARELGIYISGSDQNMNKGLCTRFAEEAPYNFMGAMDHVMATYGGMGDPSPWTARGVFEALKAGTRKMFGAQKPPVFFQGYGNVGAPMLRLSVEDGYPVSGLIDIDVDKLFQARKDGIKAPLFLQIDPEGEVSPETLFKAENGDITLVPNLVTALRKCPETIIFSPNAGPHPITTELADYLVDSEVRMVAGATNNVFDTVGGSIVPIARRLQAKGIFVLPDSEGNEVGALSVVAPKIGLVSIDPLNEDGLVRAAIGVGSLAELSYEAFLKGEPPQIVRTEAARRRYNRLEAQGLAVGGPFPGVEPAPEVTT